MAWHVAVLLTIKLIIRSYQSSAPIETLMECLKDLLGCIESPCGGLTHSLARYFIALCLHECLCGSLWMTTGHTKTYVCANAPAFRCLLCLYLKLKSKVFQDTHKKVAMVTQHRAWFETTKEWVEIDLNGPTFCCREYLLSCLWR